MRIHFSSPNFDPKQAQDHTLLVNAGQSDFMLAVLDPAGQVRLLLTADPAQLDDAFWGRLPDAFAEVRLGAADSGYLSLPADAFDEAYLDTYRRYLPTDGLAESTVADIAPLGIKLLHQTDRLSIRPFAERFPRSAVFPAIQSFVCCVAGLAEADGGQLLIVHRQAGRTTFCLIDDGNLIYLNDFETHHDLDVNYFFHTILDSLPIDQRRLRISLSGDFTPEDEFCRMLSAQLTEVMFADAAALTGVGLPVDLNGQQHRFLTLFGLRLCA